jgi:N utilization substance protein B
MASRYEQREVVIQALFEADFYESLDVETVQAVLHRDSKEFLLLEEAPEFALNLGIGTVLKKEIIDQIITKAAPEWPLEKISLIDRALLRLGIFELLYGSEYNIPPKVAINESIELAKAFGGDNSRKFVNGVLGGIFKEMQDSGQIPNPQKQQKIVVEELVGACLYKQEAGVWKVGFIGDIFKHFTWPKGHILGDKSQIEMLKEITLKEASVECSPTEILGENSYIADSKDFILRKRVVYYMAEVLEERVFVASEGIVSFVWMSEAELAGVKLYKDMRSLIKKAFDTLEKRI